MHGPLSPNQLADRPRPCEKTLLTRSLVHLAVALRKPRPKVVAAFAVATILLVEVPHYLEGRWGRSRQP
jgi:hypothetical protein